MSLKASRYLDIDIDFRFLVDNGMGYAASMQGIDLAYRPKKKGDR